MLKDREVAAMIPVRDLERARQWYEDKLRLVPDKHDADGYLYCMKNSHFALYQSEYTGTARHTLMSFSTDDLEGDMRELRSRGIRFEDYDMPGLKTVNGVASMGNDRGAWFKDLDGNILAIGTFSS